MTAWPRSRRRTIVATAGTGVEVAGDAKSLPADSSIRSGHGACFDHDPEDDSSRSHWEAYHLPITRSVLRRTRLFLSRPQPEYLIIRIPGISMPIICLAPTSETHYSTLGLDEKKKLSSPFLPEKVKLVVSIPFSLSTPSQSLLSSSSLFYFHLISSHPIRCHQLLASAAELGAVTHRFRQTDRRRSLQITLPKSWLTVAEITIRLDDLNMVAIRMGEFGLDRAPSLSPDSHFIIT
jgi:hypothetical protein